MTAVDGAVAGSVAVHLWVGGLSPSCTNAINAVPSPSFLSSPPPDSPPVTTVVADEGGDASAVTAAAIAPPTCIPLPLPVVSPIRA